MYSLFAIEKCSLFSVDHIFFFHFLTTLRFDYIQLYFWCLPLPILMTSWCDPTYIAIDNSFNQIKSKEKSKWNAFEKSVISTTSFYLHHSINWNDKPLLLKTQINESPTDINQMRSLGCKIISMDSWLVLKTAFIFFDFALLEEKWAKWNRPTHIDFKENKIKYLFSCSFLSSCLNL